MRICVIFTVGGWEEFHDEVTLRRACGALSEEHAPSDLLVHAVDTAGALGKDATITLPTCEQHRRRLAAAKGG